MSSNNITHILYQVATKKIFFVISFLVFLALFFFSESTLLLGVISGAFPFSLFLNILPGILASLFTAEAGWILVHYIVISLLIGVYVTVLLSLFSQKKNSLSFKSLSTGVFALVGVSLGITCLSCGVIGSIILISLLGTSVSSFLLTTDSTLFFFIAEILLIVSIFLLINVAKKFKLTL